MTLWFTPRIELLPFSGTVFPLKQSWYDDRTDQRVTVGFFFLNISYVVLGIWGAWRLWRWNRAVRPALLTLAIFVVLRTAFLTTLETPEPRYVLECYPVMLALGATLFGRPHKEAAASAGS
jgi:peptidoglycan/LPS O-acetylase OafA/YrhL